MGVARCQKHAKFSTHDLVSSLVVYMKAPKEKLPTFTRHLALLVSKRIRKTILICCMLVTQRKFVRVTILSILKKKKCVKKIQGAEVYHNGEPSREEWDALMDKDRAFCYNEEISMEYGDNLVLVDEYVVHDINEEPSVPMFSNDGFEDLHCKYINQNKYISMNTFHIILYR